MYCFCNPVSSAISFLSVQTEYTEDEGADVKVDSAVPAVRRPKRRLRNHATAKKEGRKGAPLLPAFGRSGDFDFLESGKGQPRSGERMQPRAQALGYTRKRKMTKPRKGRKKRKPQTHRRPNRRTPLQRLGRRTRGTNAHGS